MMTQSTTDINGQDIPKAPISRNNSKISISQPQPSSPPGQEENILSEIKTQKLAYLFHEVESQFELSLSTLQSIQEAFLNEMELGLSRDGGQLPMIPTFVTGRPTGEEIGSYFAIDLGGSNLRICLVHLRGSKQPVQVLQRKFVVPEELKSAEAKQLFDYIATHIENFILEHKVSSSNSNDTIPLGFTFSFPVTQTAINRGKLLMWNKGFTCPGALGKDVVQLLQDALDRRLLNVTVAAIVNDTVGTLLSSAYTYPNTLAGVILGTGTNAAYYEKLSNIKKWKGDPNISDEMILNIEWGSFDTDKEYIPCTSFDHKLDRETQNPYEMVLEKMISGRYLGEIVRNILLYLIDNRALFKGRSTTILNSPYQLLTSYLSEISADDSPRLTKTRHIFEDIIGISRDSITLKELETIKGICNIVARRSARLSATVLSAVVKKRMDCVEDEVTIGIDGSLFEHHPNFKKDMLLALEELMGDDATKVKLVIAKDGSGIGAAMTAMIAST
ncbi:putative glucokinase [Neoconidiobolus thromboides FSU 785]|nr:putative glucokinase [Neoconidiobolus thromboides FSU 785]